MGALTYRSIHGDQSTLECSWGPRHTGLFMRAKAYRSIHRGQNKQQYLWDQDIQEYSWGPKHRGVLYSWGPKHTGVFMGGLSILECS